MALGLDRVMGALDALGHPERGTPTIHIAGTNGKGATAAFASSILREAGKKVGLYTSPHLSRPNERIAIGGKPISDAAFAEAITAVHDASHPNGIDLTFFEVMTAAAFVAFRAAGVDAMVVEVGLGGRLDATNVLDPTVSVVTSISRDHVAVLGEDVATIAREKAGIVKTGRPVVIAARDPEAVSAIEAFASAAGAPAFVIERDLRWIPSTETRDGAFAIETTAPAPRLFVPGCNIPLTGVHQRDNAAAAALAVVLAFPKTEASTIRRGLMGARWPGRAERVRARGVELLLDGAHNPGAAAALAYGLRGEAPSSATRVDAIEKGKTPPVLLFGAMRDKEVAKVIAALAPMGARAIVCLDAAPGLARSMPAAEVAAHARDAMPGALVETADGIEAALSRAVALAQHGEEKSGLVVVTGSLYLVGRVRESLLGKPEAIG